MRGQGRVFGLGVITGFFLTAVALVALLVFCVLGFAWAGEDGYVVLVNGHLLVDLPESTYLTSAPPHHRWDYAPLWNNCRWDTQPFQLPQVLLAIGPGTAVRLFLPLWVPLVLLGVPTGLMWWQRRRATRRSGCSKCGYDLSGLGLSTRSPVVCPECGSPAQHPTGG